MRIEFISPKEWGEFLATTGASSPFHRPEWLRIVEQHSGLRTALLLGIEGTSTRIGLPLFFGRRGPIGVVLSPPPRHAIPFLGPVLARDGRGSDALQEFVGALRRKWLRGYWRIVKIDTGPWVRDLRPFLRAGFVAIPRYTYELDLTLGLKALVERADRRARRAWRVAEQEHVVREATNDEVRWIFALTEQRYRQQGKSGIAEPYSSDLLSGLPSGCLRGFVAEKEGERLTGAICVADETTVYLWRGTPKGGQDAKYSNEGLLFGILRWAVERGYARFDMVGANTPGIAHFKAMFNPDLVPYASLQRAPAPVRALIRPRTRLEAER